jgi:hypothetical protein
MVAETDESLQHSCFVLMEGTQLKAVMDRLRHPFSLMRAASFAMSGLDPGIQWKSVRVGRPAGLPDQVRQ